MSSKTYYVKFESLLKEKERSEVELTEKIRNNVRCIKIILQYGAGTHQVQHDVGG